MLNILSPELTLHPSKNDEPAIDRGQERRIAPPGECLPNRRLRIASPSVLSCFTFIENATQELRQQRRARALPPDIGESGAAGVKAN